MKLHLKNKILLGVLLLVMLMSLAYMGAVSIVIRQQYLDESHRLLENAAKVMDEELAGRRERVLRAAHELASQKEPDTDIWYLTRYAQANLDRETLVSTYQQLAQSAFGVASMAGVSRLAVYDRTGKLLVFAVHGSNWQVGFVQASSANGLQVSSETRSGNWNWKPAPFGPLVPPFRLDERLPIEEHIFYARVAGQLATCAEVPVMGEEFDAVTGKPMIVPLGFVEAVLPFDQGLVQRVAQLTGTHINIFDGHRFDRGEFSDYREVNQKMDRTSLALGTLLFNTVHIHGKGYYQCLLPLSGDHGPVGFIALLQSMGVVEKNIWQMISVLWGIALVSVLLVSPLAWYFATSLTRPMAVLIQIFRDMASTGGNFTEKMLVEHGLTNNDLSRYDELGELAQGFVAMDAAISQKIGEIHAINASLEQKIVDRTAELAAKEAESRSLIENSPDTIVRYDRECRRIYVNPAFATMMEDTIGNLLDKAPVEVPHSVDDVPYLKVIQQVFATGQVAQYELIWLNKHGEQRYSHIRLTPEFDVQGQIVTVMGVGRDMTDRVALEKTIWKQANFDSLTQLPNRQMFQDKLLLGVQSVKRSGGSLALLLIDLDRFKEVNDALGHDKGDLLLIEAAHRIHSCVREADTVARLGGDEFTVIVSGFDALATVERIAQDIITRLSLRFDLAGEEQAYISASIGISCYPQDTADLDVLFKHADQAMYAAKNGGRNRFCYFTPDLQESADMRLRMANDLRHALDDEQLVIYYQPIIDLATGALYKVEALLRWQHPERGMIDPTNFIALAEETGLIVSIGDWVFRHAVQQALHWQQRCGQPVRISVNKSPVQIHQREQLFWPDVVREIGLAAQQVTIEITEGVLLNASDEVRDRLSELRRAGMQLAIDDFGTGYSSLSYLKKFDIDFLKIDRSYIQHLDRDADQRVLCEAMIVMAHTLGLKVIAEGVETVAQQQLLLAAGCDYAQGFLYDRPLPADVFEYRWLLEGHLGSH